MSDLHWEHYPVVSQTPHARSWLQIQANLGRAPNTVDAYGRAVESYLVFTAQQVADPTLIGREHIARYVRHLMTAPPTSSTEAPARHPAQRLSNATIQLRLTAIRLYYDFLMDEGHRADNPVGRGRYTPGNRFGTPQERGLVARLHTLPWIPSEAQWQAILEAARPEPLRNRLMLALSYDAALRREEVCALQTGDIDPAHRTLRIRAETTKNHQERIVPYSEATNALYAGYLHHRRTVSQQRGRVFLSESRRNRAQPISIWTWSKVVAAIWHAPAGTFTKSPSLPATAVRKQPCATFT
jgi:integrase/recombinase XerD